MSTSSNELARWVRLSRNHEARGALTAVEFLECPFPPVRTFLVSNVPPKTDRGGHAHQNGEQLLICISGNIAVELRQGDRVQHVTCKPDGKGLHIMPGIWSKQTYLLPGSSLLALSSQPYSQVSYVDERGRLIK